MDTLVEVPGLLCVLASTLQMEWDGSS